MANVKNMYFASYVLCLDQYVHKLKNNMSYLWSQNISVILCDCWEMLY